MLCLAGTAILLMLLSVLATLSRRSSAPPSATSGVPAPLAVGTALQRPRIVPAMTLVDDRGRPFSLTAWRGKWIVLASAMTLCHEVCPMQPAH
jgi:cytochrome oxidase Cu insertion factor (SCO1/SenC/PrrC family)